MTQRKIQYWVIPPQADAEFVAHMEQVLDLYQKPYDPDCPVVCMDEQPVQLVKETRPPMCGHELGIGLRRDRLRVLDFPAGSSRFSCSASRRMVGGRLIDSMIANGVRPAAPAGATTSSP